ncbi:hypothetical protein [Paraburkholderia aromaticivorans]|uniref:hypothetical protein n=1 Tax=Paraburkholderia aromaticivorans TaxID=2026199 RepID=UPI0038BD5BA9
MRGSHELLIDPEQKLAFIACEGNDRLLVLDMHTIQVTSSAKAGRYILLTAVPMQFS